MEHVSVTNEKLTINITSVDVPIVCTGMYLCIKQEGKRALSELPTTNHLCQGTANPFPTPRTGAPDMTQGVHFNISNTIWNTTYVLYALF
jgi:hypothetical protein